MSKWHVFFGALTTAVLIWWIAAATIPTPLSKTVDTGASSAVAKGVPLRRPTEAKPIIPAKTTEECKAYWTKLLALDLSHLDLTAVNTISDSGKCNPVAKALAASQTNLQKMCRYWKETSDKKNTRESLVKLAGNTCRLGLMKYLSDMINWQHANVPPERISDPKVLSSILYSSLSTDYDRAAASAEQLLNVDPNNTAAAKAAIIAYVQMVAREKREPTAQSSWQNVNNSIDRLKKMGSDQAYFLAEMEIAGEILKGAGPKVLAPLIEKFGQDYPDKGQPHYYKAYLKVLGSDRVGALAALKEALVVDPLNLYFHAAADHLGKAKTPQQMKDSFPMTFSFYTGELLNYQ